MRFFRDLIAGSIKAENQRLNEDRERIAELEREVMAARLKEQYWFETSIKHATCLADIITEYERAKHNSVKRIVRMAREGLE